MRVETVAAMIAMAVSTDGRREIIGVCVGPSEAETLWTDFLRSLKSRGLQGVDRHRIGPQIGVQKGPIVCEERDPARRSGAGGRDGRVLLRYGAEDQARFLKRQLLPVSTISQWRVRQSKRGGQLGIAEDRRPFRRRRG